VPASPSCCTHVQNGTPQLASVDQDATECITQLDLVDHDMVLGVQRDLNECGFCHSEQVQQSFFLARCSQIKMDCCNKPTVTKELRFSLGLEDDTKTQHRVELVAKRTRGESS